MSDDQAELMTDDKMRETILAYIIIKTENTIDHYLELMLRDNQFVALANSIGLDVEKELLKILQDRLVFKLSQKGDTNV